MTSFEVAPGELQPIRIGLIGCGALGIVHGERLSALPGVTVEAVSDPDPAAMERLTSALECSGKGGRQPTAHLDYQELLRTKGLDAVAISSPNRWHVEQLLASLEAGLHVLCEKPLSLSPEEVARVVQATAASGKIVSIGYQSRYRASSKALRNALQSGEYGRVTSVDIYSSEDWVRPNAGTWRHDPERCPGGFFVDANGHQLDLLFWVTGFMPIWVRATMETRGTPVPMVTWGESRLAPQEDLLAGDTRPAYPDEGIPFTFTFVGDARLWREEINIQTELADFVMRDTQLYFSDGSARLAPFPIRDTTTDAGGVRLDVPDSAFIHALRRGEQTASPPESVWPVLRFTLAALSSAACGGAAQYAQV